jgi:serine phosphatase RsbU (regulator of sigma subunit)
MRGMAASEASTPDSMYEAVRDEARLVQDSLLPAGTLRGPGFEVAFRYKPLGEVGGDFADFFRLPDGLVGLCVGDVVGKGVTAALYAALVMGTLRGINKTGEKPDAVLALLNKRLHVRPVPGRYSSARYAMFDPVTGLLEFANAGIPLPLLVSSSGCRLLGAGGFPSGMFPDATYELHSAQLNPGDTVLFATDGLHEMQNEKEQDLSWEKLEEIWKACLCKSADESLDYLLEESRAFSENGRLHDDFDGAGTEGSAGSGWNSYGATGVKAAEGMMTFTGLAPGTTSIDFANVLLYDSNFNSIDVTTRLPRSRLAGCRLQNYRA